MFKPYIIRKHPVYGTWIIFKVVETTKIVRFVMVAELETFGDVLVLLNVGNLTRAE